MEEARQRAEEEERLHKAESERVKLLLEKRKRERIFGVTVFRSRDNHADCLRSPLVSVITGVAAFETRAADLKAQVQTLVEKGREFQRKGKDRLELMRRIR